MTFVLCLLVTAASPQTRRITPADLPPALQEKFPTARLDEVDASSEKRLRQGEFDHLVFYILQSTAFTKLPIIEPAQSARAFIENNRQIAAAVSARIDSFLAAPASNPRAIYFRKLLAAESQPREAILREYQRGMDFLYEKEVRSLQKQGDSRRAFISALYPKRGHSSDTSIDASFTLHVGLTAAQQIIKGLRAERILLIGPGLDFSPRTNLNDRDQPQSYQPFFLADSLLRLGLALPGKWQIQCVDLNPRVVDYFSQPPTQLHWSWQPQDQEQRDYAARLGHSIGTVKDASVRFRPLPVSAVKMNILTERLTGPPFDLAVATNVLLYFNDDELGLAMANIQAMLKPGGLFLHNDLRDSVQAYAATLNMPVVHARMIRLSERRQLYDSIVIQRKDPGSPLQ